MKTATQRTTDHPGLTLLLGGTGKTGSRIARRLEERGAKTRIASRSAACHFDWNDQGTWHRALEGVTSAYIAYAPDLAIPGATDTIRQFVDQAVKAGVQRLVLLSGRGEKEAQACERLVADSGLEWCVVRASWFNQNFSEGEFLGMVLDGSITLPAADIEEPFVDMDDIADVVVAALTEDGHNGEIYEVTGPRLLSFAQAATEMAEASGRQIQFLQISRAAFVDGLTASGAPEDIVWLMDYLFGTVLDGRNAWVGDGVQRALGRQPKDFRHYAEVTAASGHWRVAA